MKSLVFLLGNSAAFAMAAATDPSFPLLPQAFNMTTAFWQPATATGAPMATQTVTWDSDARRGFIYENDAKTNTFMLQISRCDLAVPKVTIVTGDPAADPSTYACTVDTSKNNACGDNWKPFWARPPPPCPGPTGVPCSTFNGTATINGVTCNEFDWGAPGTPFHDSKFWATSTAPCRATHPSQREDYLTFDGTAPPISAFDGPAWFKGLPQCGAVSVEELPAVPAPRLR